MILGILLAIAYFTLGIYCKFPWGIQVVGCVELLLIGVWIEWGGEI